MESSRPAVREIAWRDIFPGLLLLRCFRIALDPRKLVLAALGLGLTWIGWQVIDRVAPTTAGIENIHTPAIRGPSGILVPPWPDDPERNVWDADPVRAVWEQLSTPYRRLFAPRASVQDIVALVCAVAWAALVWGLFGGAITRIAAVQLTRDQRYSVGRALGFARGRLLSYLAAPLLPLVAVAVAVVLAGLLPGLLMRADAGLFLVGLVWWLLLILVGLTLAILLLGLLVGWPLLWAAISVEGTDAFDAISRAYSYTFQRPLHYLVYTVVAGVLGALGAIIVALFAVFVIYLTAWTVSWGSGASTMAEVFRDAPSHLQAPLVAYDAASTPAGQHSTLGRGGLWMIGAANDGVTILALGFIYSFFWTAATAIYILLRLSADARETDEVFLEDPLDDAKLPALEPDASGVPVLAEEAD